MSTNAHQLEEHATQALCLTPQGLTDALKHAKKCGYTGMTLVPLLFHTDLTAEVAAQIAHDEGMRIDACLFLPGDQFTPHSKGGKQKALDEVRRQCSYQKIWREAKVGGVNLWGPSGQGFKGEFQLDGYKDWIHSLSLIAGELELFIAIEVLNQMEQAAAPEDIFDLTAKVIDEVTGNGRIGLHYDTVHAWMRMKEGMINFVRGNKDKIFVVEFANKNRLPFDIDCGIDFASHMAEIPNLRRGISIGSEAFCSSVIAQLEIGDIYNTTILGRVARERNAVYLRKQGWM